ncbi:hypothetical protein SCHPADRAFT_892311 [Schizopora paradoxa]|uniref:Uncharacterized protein n=1 Tax=Schizopora paradoxa TaxID=27342 RepID=A0A0H2RFA0_9AGAM|nr:hypothetical protein SCHPADRAFT_892311 [Schizopora paradoxa]
MLLTNQFVLPALINPQPPRSLPAHPDQSLYNDSGKFNENDALSKFKDLSQLHQFRQLVREMKVGPSTHVIDFCKERRNGCEGCCDRDAGARWVESWQAAVRHGMNDEAMAREPSNLFFSFLLTTFIRKSEGRRVSRMLQVADHTRQQQALFSSGAFYVEVDGRLACRALSATIPVDQPRASLSGMKDRVPTGDQWLWNSYNGDASSYLRVFKAAPRCSDEEKGELHERIIDLGRRVGA